MSLALQFLQLTISKNQSEDNQTKRHHTCVSTQNKMLSKRKQFLNLIQNYLDNCTDNNDWLILRKQCIEETVKQIDTKRVPVIQKGRQSRHFFTDYITFADGSIHHMFICSSKPQKLLRLRKIMLLCQYHDNGYYWYFKSSSSEQYHIVDVILLPIGLCIHCTCLGHEKFNYCYHTRFIYSIMKLIDVSFIHLLSCKELEQINLVE